MKIETIITVCTLLCFVAVSSVWASPETTEDALIRTLESDGSPSEKIEACKQIKLLALSKAIPALAVLLADDDVALFARDALETMPDPEAGQALQESLKRVQGANKVGVIYSLGARGESDSVKALAPLLDDADTEIASAAAVALGNIGGSKAARALERALAVSSQEVRTSVVEGLLSCANQFLAMSIGESGQSIYEMLYKPSEDRYVRQAAYRGLVLSSPEPITVILSGLQSDDEAARDAALQLVPEMDTEENALAFAAILPKVAPPEQAALIDALTELGSETVIPSLVAMADSPSEDVRIAVFRALGKLGGPNEVSLLAQSAAGSKGVEQRTARAALVRLKGEEVPEAMVSALREAEPAAASELALALASREETQTTPMLISMAMVSDKAEVRIAVAQALRKLGDESNLAEMVGLLCRAEGEKERAEFEAALSSILARSEEKELSVKPLLSALGPARSALLRVAGVAGGPEVLDILRQAVHDEDEKVRDAAVRTLAESDDPKAMPDLIELAREAESQIHRVLAIRGYWRLLAQSSDLPMQQRWELCKAGMDASERPEEKKLGFTQLSTITNVEALRLALDLAEDEKIRSEAELACLSIAAGIRGTDSDAGKAALAKLAKGAADENTRRSAEKMLEALKGGMGSEYVLTWRVAGPYREHEKDSYALLDTAFAPEKSGLGDVVWKPISVPADDPDPWQVVLDDVVQGDLCVVYLKANVSVPKAQRVRFDIGSDDGVKLWVNDDLVHVNNIQRGITRDQDTAEGELEQGSNVLLLKISQNIMGCGASVRIRNLDGSPVDGLLCW